MLSRLLCCALLLLTVLSAPLRAQSDSISAYLVFAPTTDRWFVAAARNKRLLLDVGRVDMEVRKDSAVAAAYRAAAAKRSPIGSQARFRLRGPWGAEDVTAGAFDSWNGRIVMRLSPSATVDSLLRKGVALVATAERSDSARAATVDSCARSAPVAPEWTARVGAVKDSVLAEFQKSGGPPYERLARRLSTASSQVVGCFAPKGARAVALAVTMQAGDHEWVRERIVLVDSLGKATPLRVQDLRFRAHALLGAFDADGDGVDDLVTRASTERSGATTVLSLDLRAKKLTRVAAGFAWEQR
jgi:hypothetical protein